MPFMLACRLGAIVQTDQVSVGAACEHAEFGPRLRNGCATTQNIKHKQTPAESAAQDSRYLALIFGSKNMKHSMQNDLINYVQLGSNLSL